MHYPRRCLIIDSPFQKWVSTTSFLRLCSSPANHLSSSFRFPQFPLHPFELTHLMPEGLKFPPSPCLSVDFQIHQIAAYQSTKFSLLHVPLSRAQQHVHFSRVTSVPTPGPPIKCDYLAKLSPVLQAQDWRRHSWGTEGVTLKTQTTAPFCPKAKFQLPTT